MSDHEKLNAIKAQINQDGEKILAIPGVQAAITLVSVMAEDGSNTTFMRFQGGNVHAVEGLLREKIREMEHYENGYHQETGRYDAVQHRQNRQARERRERGDDDGEGWKRNQ